MMPKCTLSQSTIFIKDDASGEMLELGNIEKLELEEIQIEHESADYGAKYISYPPEVTATYRLKTISRKKFIKLLMSRKIQRSAANELAKYFLNKRGYYSYIDLFLLDGGVL